MSEVLAFGEREIEPNGTFVPTDEEKTYLDDNNISAAALQSFVDISGKQTINAAVGGIVQKRANEAKGEEVAIPPTPEAEPEATPEVAPEVPEAPQTGEEPEVTPESTEVPGATPTAE